MGKRRKVRCQRMRGAVESGDSNYWFECSSLGSFLDFGCCEDCHKQGQGWYVRMEGHEYYVCCGAMDAMLRYEQEQGIGRECVEVSAEGQKKDPDIFDFWQWITGKASKKKGTSIQKKGQDKNGTQCIQ